MGNKLEANIMKSLVKKTIDKLLFSENNFSYLEINKALPSKIKYSQETDAFIGEYLENLEQKHLIFCVLDSLSEISKVYVRHGLIHPNYLQMN